MTEDGRSELVVDLIEAGVLAGAYRSLAREMPDAERGLLKMAAKHSARVAALAGEIAAGAGQTDRASAAMPNRQTR